MGEGRGYKRFVLLFGEIQKEDKQFIQRNFKLVELGRGRGWAEEQKILLVVQKSGKDILYGNFWFLVNGEGVVVRFDGPYMKAILHFNYLFLEDNPFKSQYKWNARAALTRVYLEGLKHFVRKLNGGEQSWALPREQSPESKNLGGKAKSVVHLW